jgi:hypothetical protein
MLELKESDKDHVQRFSDFIKSSYPLTTIRPLRPGRYR